MLKKTKNNAFKNIPDNDRRTSTTVKSYLRECCKLFEILDGAEQLQADARRDYQQAHSEQHKTAEFLARPEYLTTERSAATIHTDTYLPKEER